MNKIKCERCSGDGWTEHSPGHNRDCKKCNATGYIEDKNGKVCHTILKN